jgi:opacity protein-like surface antigen
MPAGKPRLASRRSDGWGGRALTLALAAIAVPSVAAADDGWYGRIDGGYSIDSRLEIEASASITSSPSIDDGAFAAIALGYGSEGHWRFEAELAHRDEDVEADVGLDQGGTIKATTLLFNAYYDFGSNEGSQPYVGVGIGVASAEIDISNSAPLNTVVIEDDQTGFAYQVLAGVAVPLTQALRVDVGYRYLGGVSIEGEGSAPPLTSLPFDADLADHAVTLGLRWDF